MKTKKTEIVKQDITGVTKELVNNYLVKNIVGDFTKIPTEMKLAFLQQTPKDFIKHREIQGTKIPYVDHYYAERCLNFISNFQWGAEKLSSVVEERIETGGDGKERRVWEATVEMKMWIMLNDQKIERYIVSGHKMYENPAITKADAIKSAVSKANTVFARQFGIGSNIIDEEGNAFERVEQAYDRVQAIEDGKKPKKTLSEEKFKQFLSMDNEYIESHKDLIAFTKDQEAKLNERLSNE